MQWCFPMPTRTLQLQRSQELPLGQLASGKTIFRKDWTSYESVALSVQRRLAAVTAAAASSLGLHGFAVLRVHDRHTEISKAC